jgi:alpha-tubulin suppressor-like RCC1 family protein
MSLFFSAIANKKAAAGGGGAVGLIDVGGAIAVYASGSSGKLWAWGQQNSGEIGDNSTTNRSFPVAVLGATKTFCKISAGGTFTLAISNSGRAWGWGYNGNGTVGDNTITNRLTPVSVLGAVKTFCHISAGFGHSLAIDKNGRAWGWGYNGVGQLGDNTIISKRTPISVLGAVKTFCQISGGNGFTMAIDKNGRAWGWGGNGYGQLGINTVATLSVRTPVSVLGTVKTFCEIVASIGNDPHVLALDKNGRAWAWGANFGGQLGNNSAVFSVLTPVSVLGAVKTFCKIAVSGLGSHAIDKNGRVWGWGANLQGQIGDNTAVSKRTPVSVLGAVKTFCQISAGGGNAFAITHTGKVWGWGFNYNGRLGNNSAVLSEMTPVQIANL